MSTGLAVSPLSAGDARRLAYRQGAGRADDGGLVREDYREESAPLAPARALPGRGVPLPLGTRRLLAGIPWPQTGTPPRQDAIAHLLLAALGVTRREPSNPYNDHRHVASVRSRFPVHAFLEDGRRAWWVDPVRMHLVEMEGEDEAPDGVRVQLAARWSDLPRFYERLRGALCNIETGIALRSVGLAATALGIAAATSSEDAEALAARLGLTTEAGWAQPIVLEVIRANPGRHVAVPGPDVSAAIAPVAPFAPVEPPGAALDDIRRADAGLRAQDPEPAAPVEALPDGLDGAVPRSWSDVLWARTAGRMPLGMTGYDGRRSALSARGFSDLCRWLRMPPPDGRLRSAAERCTVTLVVQDVEGTQDGAYDLDEGGALRPRERRAGLLAMAETHYGYPLAPPNGCALRTSTVLCLIHASPRDLVEDLGPAGWQAAQRWAGWAAHGLCVGAGALGLYARPALAFDEVSLGAELGFNVDATLLITITCGAGRFQEPMLDLRT